MGPSTVRTVRGQDRMVAWLWRVKDERARERHMVGDLALGGWGARVEEQGDEFRLRQQVEMPRQGWI